MVCIDNEMLNNKTNIESDCPVYGFIHYTIEHLQSNPQLLPVTITENGIECPNLFSCSFAFFW
ncbi:MAG: hypothetical protein A2Y62_13825 [Candidatus Fischerbacteria bacterium RBG_13_37_8]|uniref:Uncharacterized protein n=1 Tax=Candidatus Fischerbacteria bacterium RBG_13_37_8 TaxID=1817863 RepID=A0A1F5VX93_9BACT|nr:MAG: hypothetical protein A2Y62_13825 [Candidatus Fischerbacteria bacterium RBG_13_37_8]